MTLPRAPRDSRRSGLGASRFGPTIVAATVVAAGITAPALAGDARALLGWDDLIARLGAAAPTGADVAIGVVEAEDAGGNWGPNLAAGELSDLVLTVVSPGPTGTSGHATEVFRNFLGNDQSVAPGISDAWLWEAGDWIFEFLNTNEAGSIAPAPLPGPLRVLNNSWIGTVATASANDALRRHDLVADRDELLIVSGVANDDSSNPPLLSHAFNGLAVGDRDGLHAAAATAAGIDGPGRMKPEIVGVEQATSFSTPQVAAVAAVLLETALTDPGLIGDANADDIEVLKAVLLNSATKENTLTGTWDNGAAVSGPARGTTVTPIDDIVGAGTVHVDRAHQLLTAGRQSGSTDPAATAGLPSLGWDRERLTVGSSRYWGLSLGDPDEPTTVTLTWNRTVRLSTGQWFLPDLDLHLWRRGPGGTLEPLTGDDGLGVFSGGNVTSESPVDNIEHLHVIGLAPGAYVLEVRRVDTGGLPPGNFPFAIAWSGPAADFAVEDLDQDGIVGIGDLLIVLASWGPCKGCPADQNGDGTVGLIDLLAILSAWD